MLLNENTHLDIFLIYLSEVFLIEYDEVILHIITLLNGIDHNN